MDLTWLGDNLIGPGKENRWVSRVLISYPRGDKFSANTEIYPKEGNDVHDLKAFVYELLPNKKVLDCYITDDDIHFMVKVGRMIIAQTGYFSFVGCSPVIKEIKTDADWLFLRAMLEAANKEEIKELEIREPDQVPSVWTIDPLAFRYNKEHEARLKERINSVNSFLKTYDETTQSSRDIVAAVPVPVKRKGRPRLRIVDEKK
jgi:hypothetical protein